MAYFIDGKDCMISEWILLALAFGCVGWRLYIRLVRLRARLDVSDWLLIVSVLDAVGLIICDTLTYEMGVMDEWEASEKLSKISFASNYFYDVGMGFPKLSMLAFYWTYYKSSWAGRPSLRNTLWAIVAFVVACYLTILFDDTFYCGKDVAVQWSQEEGACSVFYATPPFILNFTLNLACYLFLYAVPLMFLFCDFDRRRLHDIFLTLALGFLTIVSSVVRFATLKAGTSQPNLVYPLSMLEMTLSIMVMSVLGIRLLVKSHQQRRTDIRQGYREREGGFAETNDPDERIVAQRKR